jgi:hypothetical protein
MNPEQIIYQHVPRATLLFQKFCDLELVNATMPVTCHTWRTWGKDQAPTIVVGGRWAARASVKLPLDHRHARSIHCFPVSIYDGGRRRDAAFKAANFKLRHYRCLRSYQAKKINTAQAAPSVQDCRSRKANAIGSSSISPRLASSHIRISQARMIGTISQSDTGFP